MAQAIGVSQLEGSGAVAAGESDLDLVALDDAVTRLAGLIHSRPGW